MVDQDTPEPKPVFSFPADFVARIKKEIPGNEELHRRLDANHLSEVREIFKRLWDSWADVNIEDVIRDLDNGKTSQLRKRAKGASRARVRYWEVVAIDDAWAKTLKDYYAREKERRDAPHRERLRQFEELMSSRKKRGKKKKQSSAT